MFDIAPITTRQCDEVLYLCPGTREIPLAYAGISMSLGPNREYPVSIGDGDIGDQRSRRSGEIQK